MAKRIAFDAEIEPGRARVPGLVTVPDRVVRALGVTSTATVLGAIAGTEIARQSLKRKGAGASSGWFVDVTTKTFGAARLSVGEVVVVELEVVSDLGDDELLAAFAAEPLAQRWWDAASHAKRRQLVNDVERAASPETRARRIAKWVEETAAFQRTLER